ncbi:MAG: hypothetical protein F2911_09645 [Actinobacteria bacterium]|nr:hypothetical protein [Actinomycetota bacterium]MSW38004.1 hypothetical protein [Actinomycetota bacterium]
MTSRLPPTQGHEKEGAILHALFGHIAKPEHIINHPWSAGNVVFWDNRNTVH